MGTEYWTNWQGPAPTLDSLSLHPQLLLNIFKGGFESLVPLQRLAIPSLLSHRNLICQSPSGTGKTTAYILPLLQSIDTSCLQTQGLILCPGREIAYNIAQYISKLSEEMGICICACVGGTQIRELAKTLKSGVHIVVATPGRALDFIKKGVLSLKSVKTVVLDEADELIERGFNEIISEIILLVPEQAQLALLSATSQFPLGFNVKNAVFIFPEPAVCLRTEQQYQLQTKCKFTTLISLLDRFYGLSVIICCQNDASVLDLLTKLLESDRRVGALVCNMQYPACLSTTADVTNEAVITSRLFDRDIERFGVVIHYEAPSNQLFEQSIRRFIKVNWRMWENLPIVIVLDESLGLPELPDEIKKPETDYKTVLEWIRTKEHWHFPVISTRKEALTALIQQLNGSKTLICCKSDQTVLSISADFPDIAVAWDGQRETDQLAPHSALFLTYNQYKADYLQGYTTAIIYELPWNTGQYVRFAALSLRIISITDREEWDWLQEVQTGCGITLRQWQI